MKGYMGKILRVDLTRAARKPKSWMKTWRRSSSRKRLGYQDPLRRNRPGNRSSGAREPADLHDRALRRHSGHHLGQAPHGQQVAPHGRLHRVGHRRNLGALPEEGRI